MINETHVWFGGGSAYLLESCVRTRFSFPVLPDISGRHFFSTVPHDWFPCSEARHQPAASAFPRTTVRRRSEAFPAAVSDSLPSPGVSVRSVCLTGYHLYCLYERIPFATASTVLTLTAGCVALYPALYSVYS